MAGLVIKPRSRIFHGHDWVYSSEVQKIFGDPKPGSVISLKDFRDRPLGSAIYNPDSQIAASPAASRISMPTFLTGASAGLLPCGKR